MVRKAFNYKYLGGSLIDYALAKERLCQEVEPKGTELYKINQIVFGLPNEVQDELDREEITTLDKMYTELRKLEDLFSRKMKVQPLTQRLNSKPTSKPLQKNDPQRKPCSICVGLGFQNRYHLVAECRNKKSTADKIHSNATEHAPYENDLEILNIDLEKENLN